MMTSTTCNDSILKEAAELDRAADFLADYASLLLGCGATCIRIEKNTRRMAQAFGFGFDIFIMPNHLTVSVWGIDRADTSTAMRKTAACGISFSLNARLSRLSWEVADNHMDLAAAIHRFDRIKETRPTGRHEVLILASVANASFCRLFGGDPMAMLIVFISTLGGYRLKQIMLEMKCDVRVTFICASFFSASLSTAGQIFHIGGTPEVAVGTSVLYLIPGVPYINSVSDLLCRHYLCASSRFMDAVVLTICLSAGLCAGMFLLGLNWF